VAAKFLFFSVKYDKFVNENIGMSSILPYSSATIEPRDMFSGEDLARLGLELMTALAVGLLPEPY